MMAALEVIDPAEPQPWEQQPREPRLAYAKFCQYRDLGPLRGLRQMRSPNPGQTASNFLRQIAKLSSEWGWAERAKQYDAMMDRERIGARIAAVREMETRHAQIAEAGLAALSMPLIALGRPRTIAGIPQGNDRLAELQELPTGDLIRLAAHASRSMGRLTQVERQARREDEELPETQTGSPVAPLPEETRLRQMFEAFAESGLMVRGTFEVGAPEREVGEDGLPVLEAVPVEPDP